jgi:ATP-dependent helicase/nuclease subunit A
LFEDAPLNDMYHLLRLAVYPDDRLSYAAVLRSAFAGLSDETLAVCMLRQGADAPPAFDEALDEAVPPADRPNFARARALLAEVRRRARTEQNCDIVTYLWYETGYRYETLWKADFQSYASLYDLFFELARQSDARGEGLAAFIDSVADYADRGVFDDAESDLSVPGEPEDAGPEAADRPARVQCMSIHKSKGLEFPVVFIFAGGSGGRQTGNGGLVYYHETYGLSVNLGEVEDVPAETKNYFYQLSKDDENQKQRAELRRLLYVGMTRAREELYFTATDAQKDDGAPAPGAEKSFLDLLRPALMEKDAGGAGLFDVAALPAMKRADTAGKEAGDAAGRPKNITEAIARAEALYAGRPAHTPNESDIIMQNASALDEAAGLPAGGAGDALDALLKKAGLEAREFGSIVHAFIQDHYDGRAGRIPPKLDARLDADMRALITTEADAMRARWTASWLGRLAGDARFREAEFPVLTFVREAGRRVVVNGVLDLLFEADGVMYIIDFKSGRLESTSHYAAQLAVYRRAVEDIYRKPVRTFLYYLRSGKCVELPAPAGPEKRRRPGHGAGE